MGRGTLATTLPLLALLPAALALQRAGVLMMPRALVQGPRAALGSVLPGP